MLTAAQNQVAFAHCLAANRCNIVRLTLAICPVEDAACPALKRVTLSFALVSGRMIPCAHDNVRTAWGASPQVRVLPTPHLSCLRASECCFGTGTGCHGDKSPARVGPSLFIDSVAHDCLEWFPKLLKEPQQLALVLVHPTHTAHV